MRLSRQVSKGQVWTLQAPAHTDLFLTYQFCQNYLSVLLHVNYWTVYCLIIYCHHYNLAFAQVWTASLHVLSDILTAVDNGDFSALVHLDLSSAFDTVDRSILLERLCRLLGIMGSAHQWFVSYLTAWS
jgi:hypothetical protein